MCMVIYVYMKNTSSSVVYLLHALCVCVCAAYLYLWTELSTCLCKASGFLQNVNQLSDLREK